MHVVQSTLILKAPQNDASITLLVSGENAHMTKIIHEMCLRAVQYAVEPLQPDQHEDLPAPAALE